MNNKILIVVGIVLVFSFTFASAMNIDFYYSETYSYCQKIMPVVAGYGNLFIDYTFNWFNVAEEKNQKDFRDEGFEAVPAFVINTDDGREIKFTGANQRKLDCELNQMSTLDYEIYRADSSITNSWFID